MPTLLERQRELLALRTTGVFLVEALNGKVNAWMADDFSKFEAIRSRLTGEFSDLGGEAFATELSERLLVRSK